MIKLTLIYVIDVKMVTTCRKTELNAFVINVLK